MVDVARREDAYLDELSRLYRERRQLHAWLDLCAEADPVYAPVFEFLADQLIDADG